MKFEGFKPGSDLADFVLAQTPETHGQKDGVSWRRFYKSYIDSERAIDLECQPVLRYSKTSIGTALKVAISSLNGFIFLPTEIREAIRSRRYKSGRWVVLFNIGFDEYAIRISSLSRARRLVNILRPWTNWIRVWRWDRSMAWESENLIRDGRFAGHGPEITIFDDPFTAVSG